MMPGRSAVAKGLLQIVTVCLHPARSPAGPTRITRRETGLPSAAFVPGFVENYGPGIRATWPLRPVQYRFHRISSTSVSDLHTVLSLPSAGECPPGSHPSHPLAFVYRRLSPRFCAIDGIANCKRHHHCIQAHEAADPEKIACLAYERADRQAQGHLLKGAIASRCRRDAACRPLAVARFSSPWPPTKSSRQVVHFFGWSLRCDDRTFSFLFSVRQRASHGMLRSLLGTDNYDRKRCRHVARAARCTLLYSTPRNCR